MSAFSSLAFSLLIASIAGTTPFTPPSDLETGVQSDTVYYYIDHSCTCSPSADLAEDSYWLITESIHAAQHSEIEQITATYKRFLDQQFATSGAMTHDIVVRYQPTASEAQAARAHKLDKMSRQGYTILETAFSPIH